MDINKVFPPPKNPEPGSPEAILKAILDIAAPNGGLWLLGRHTYHTRVMAGVTDQQAMYEAVCAASRGDVRRITPAMERYGASFNGQSDSRRPKFLTTLTDVFGSRPRN